MYRKHLSVFTLPGLVAEILIGYLILFFNLEQHELESNNFLSRFADLIADYRSYESNAVKASPYSIFDEHDMTERISCI